MRADCCDNCRLAKLIPSEYIGVNLNDQFDFTVDIKWLMLAINNCRCQYLNGQIEFLLQSVVGLKPAGYWKRLGMRLKEDGLLTRSPRYLHWEVTPMGHCWIFNGDPVCFEPTAQMLQFMWKINVTPDVAQ